MKLWPQAPAQPPRDTSAQCPNCGAYGDQIDVLSRDLRTGATYRPAALLDAQATGIIFVASVVVSYIFVTWLVGPDSLWPVLITSVILTLVVIGVWTVRHINREAHAIRILRYKCARCLHEWDQQEGKPAPRFNEAQEVAEDYQAVFGTSENHTTTHNPN
jgi:hypothetical protein